MIAGQSGPPSWAGTILPYSGAAVAALSITLVTPASSGSSMGASSSSYIVSGPLSSDRQTGSTEFMNVGGLIVRMSRCRGSGFALVQVHRSSIAKFVTVLVELGSAELGKSNRR